MNNDTANKDAEKIIEESINWNEINFPEIWPLIHYKFEECSNRSKYLIRIMKFSLIILVIIQLVNLLDTIISVAGAYFSAFNVLYCFLNFFMILIFYSFTCYNGYIAFIIKDTYLRVRFLVLISCNICLFTAFSIINTGCFNGWFRIIVYGKNGEPGAIICMILGILESSGYILVSSFSLWQLLYFILRIDASKLEQSCHS